MDSIRQTIGKTIHEYAKSDKTVYALTADLAGSLGFDAIKEDLPQQFIECGIAEQEMMSLSAGLSLSGNKPFCGSFAAFNPGRNWDQLRVSGCYNQTPIRVVSSHYGLSVGGDGATHQCLEYLAITLCLPNLRVFVPFNNSSAKWCVDEMYNENSLPSIIFQPREKHSIEIDTIDSSNLENGFIFKKSNKKSQEKNLIITAGLVSSQAYNLESDESSPSCDYVFLVDLTNINRTELSNLIKNYENLIILEEHQEFGGIGSIIFQIIAQQKISIQISHLCIKKEFGKSSSNGQELYDLYKLNTDSIKSKLI